MSYICLKCKKMCSTLLALSKHISQTEKMVLSDYYDLYIDPSNKTCKICKLEKRIFLNLRLGYSDTCRNKTCVNASNEIKRKKSNQEKYNCTNVSQITEVKNKRKITFQKRFGCDTPLQNEDIAKKMSDTLRSKGDEYWSRKYKKYESTCLERYNTPNVNSLECIKQKKIDTNQRNRNVDYPMQCRNVKRKYNETSRLKYGVDWPTQNPTIIEKSKSTCRRKYHRDYISQDKTIQKRIRSTNIEKFGGPAPYCFKDIQEKGKQTCLEHYGVDNYSKTLEFRRFARQKMIDLIMSGYKDGSKFRPTKGKHEKEIFDEIQKYCSYTLLEDQSFNNLFPDRYIKELNIVLELYEPWHNHSWCKKHDPIRQKELEDYLGCTFFIIWLNDWLSDKDQIIQNFIGIINDKDMKIPKPE